MPDRLRAALETRPDLLWRLLRSFKKTPPHILGPWVPTRSTNTFAIERQNTSGYEVIRISRPLPNTGPWQVKYVGPKLTPELQSSIDKITNGPFEGGSYNFDELRDLVDAAFHFHGWVVLESKFPGVTFGPWQPSEDGRHLFRPVQILEGVDNPFVSAPVIGPRELEDEEDRFKAIYSLPLETGTITGKGWSQRQVRQWADDNLVELGFDLARPECFDLIEMRRNKDKDLEWGEAMRKAELKAKKNGLQR